MNCRGYQTSKRGTNLIELVLILPVILILTVQVTIAIRNIFHLSGIAKHRSHAVLHISALERMIRNDAHEAIRAYTDKTSETEKKLLRFEFADGRVAEYRTWKGGIERAEVRNEQRQSIEMFDLFESMEFEIEVRESKPAWLEISAYRTVKDMATRGRLELHLETVVGRYEEIAP